MRKTLWSNKYNVDKRIQIQGANNSVFIGECTAIYNLQIFIHGNHNCLSIGKGCITSGLIEMFGNSNEITIGDNSVLSNDVRITARGGKYIRIGSGCVTYIQQVFWAKKYLPRHIV